jgi:hypothetical protein
VLSLSIVHLRSLLNNMQIVTDFGVPSGTSGQTAGAIDLLTKNTLTTAGVILGSGTAVAGATLLTVALPAQMLGAVAVTGSLLYAGDRQAKGKSINPFANSEAAAKASDLPVVEKEIPSKTEDAAPASEPVAETAAA